MFRLQINHYGMHHGCWPSSGVGLTVILTDPAPAIEKMQAAMAAVGVVCSVGDMALATQQETPRGEQWSV